MNILKINNQDIINPSSLVWDESDLISDEGSGVNMNGKVFRDRIDTKRRITASFPPMNDAQMSSLLEAISPAFFDLEYPDPRLGKRETITVYVGERSVPVYMYDETSGQWIWQGISVEFTER